MKTPKFKSVKQDEFMSLDDARMTELREDAEQCASVNRDQYDVYWTKAKRVLALIEEMFPTKTYRDRNWNTKKREQQITKYVRKKLEEASPRTAFNGMRPFDDFVNQVEKYKKENEDRLKREERENQRKEEYALRRTRAIRFGAVRGWMDINTPDDFIDKAREADKYLDLASAMEATRGDWSDGFYRVRNSLNRFNVETPTDAEIVADVESCMDADDGRVFRDTDWNYNRLYGMVDNDLMREIGDIMGDGYYG